MSERDDQEWLDGLAGGAGTSADSIDGAQLRRAIQQRTMPTVQAVPDRDATREAMLIARARREGVIKPAATTGADSPRRWLLGWRGALAMVAVAGVAVWIGFAVNGPFFDSQDEMETVRGVADGDAVIEAVDPAAMRGAIIDALQELNVEAVAYDSITHQGIEVVLPDPLPDEASALLERFDIAPPLHSEFTIIIVPKTR